MGVAMHILQKNPNSYVKGKMYWDLQPVIGGGLVTSEGEVWKTHRRLINPQFKVTALHNYYEDIMATNVVLLEKLNSLAEKEETFNLALLLTQYSLDVIGKLAFSYQFDSLQNKNSHLFQLVESTLKSSMDFHFMNPLLKAFPTKIWKKFETDIALLRQEISKIIAHHQTAEREQKTNLLTQLLDSGLSAEEIRDEICTFLIAGHETTANCLTWTVFLLSQHPEAEEQLALEIKRVLKGEIPTIENLSQLKYLDCVLKESMRLFPPIPAVGRDCAADDMIKLDNEKTLLIPSGLTIFISLTAIHNNPDIYSDPEAFQPERFLDPASAPVVLPFSDGPRSCIGKRLALLEAKLVLCMIYQKFSFTLKVDPKSVQTHPTVSLRPKHGIDCLCKKKELI